MVVSENMIGSCFAEASGRGWSPKGGSMREGWHAIYEGKLRDYDAYLDIDGDWIYLQCPILLAEPVEECKPALYEYLLRANDTMYFAKFSLFDARPKERLERWAALTSECPAEMFSTSVFRLMTEAISSYAERYQRELQTMAYDPAIAQYAVRLQEAAR